jgi:hypothetical protein
VLRVIPYSAILDVPRALAQYVSRLLKAERPAPGTRRSMACALTDPLSAACRTREPVDFTNQHGEDRLKTSLTFAGGSATGQTTVLALARVPNPVAVTIRPPRSPPRPPRRRAARPASSGAPAATDKVMFTYAERCLASGEGCGTLTEDTRDNSRRPLRRRVQGR